ncbi:DNA-directed RNA polymerase [Fimicolochytrium jonesii]|uniref:DNA-directed RNA polymerase n=1 Tax=Fimicolochytrium jonesii TaxID=1396493 RepID=UPI0022FF0F26|nr:DNA-directed RNA polymerase [Fimicolochytrium jonesii]KAI8818682.1 DNA-directed RNA polymerase [Fimicolochytrium jonesii]
MQPSSLEFPGNFPGEDLAWDLEKFKQNFQIVVGFIGKDDMEFDMIGVDASIANAFRRILIGEVPTMAIEKVYVLNNTSIMHDEILAQRLGLIPIKCDPRAFQFRLGTEDTPTDENTLVFKLFVECKKNPEAPTSAVDPSVKYIHSNVLSGDLEWIPQGLQSTRFANRPVGPVIDDILITKMRPGQIIDVELHCQKGIGKEHAKWSPVATASYRLLPDIQILKPITGDSAYRFQKCFPEGVVAVDENAAEARVVNPRKDTVSREVLRHPEFEDKVRLTRVRDHFLFSIESTGILPPQVLFTEAAKLLIHKCQVVKNALRDSGALSS